MKIVVILAMLAWPYVGIEGNFGRVAIGNQWDPHYNITAGVTDIYNHRSSPFGYDTIGPFRTHSVSHVFVFQSVVLCWMPACRV